MPVVAGAQSVTAGVKGSIPTRINDILSISIFFALESRQRSALSSSAQHATPPEFGGKWEAECLNTMFPLPSIFFSKTR